MNLKNYGATLTILCLISSLGFSAEVDQFTHRHLSLQDSSKVINQQINNYIRKSIATINDRSEGCHPEKLYKEMQKYLQNHINGEIVAFIEHESAIDKFITTPDDSIYREWTMWDGFILARPGASTSPLAMSPLIRVKDQVIGVDKLEHLFDRGYAYFKDHYLEKKSMEETLIDGIWWEKALYGGKKWGTGVFSYGDLAANFNGLRFWNDVLGNHRDVLGRQIKPYISCENNQWKQLNLVDISNYIDASYDEAINCSKFATSKTADKVMLQLNHLGIKHCPLSSRQFEQLKHKYGPYSRFILNSDGIEVSESVKVWREKLDILTGWRKVPSKFNPLFTGRYPELEYNTERKYLRQFRYKDRNSDREETRVMSWDYIKINEAHPNKKLIDCWYLFLSGGDCDQKVPAPLPSAYTEKGTLDLLTYARDVSRQSGLVAARAILLEKLQELDASKGVLKERIIKTTLDKKLTFNDSLSTIENERRKKIGVYLVLGIGGDDSDNARLIRKAADTVAQLGFSAEMLEVDPNLGSDYNAKLLKGLIEERIKKLDKIVFVAASKGASDFITYFLNYGDTLAKQDRQKVELMVTLSGVVRSSFVAEYLASSNRLTAFGVRNFLRATGKGQILKGIESLSVDPWRGHDPQKIKRLFPALKWMSFPSLPEAKTALTDLSLWAGFLRSPVHSWTTIASPSDGLVETAASVLPPDTGLHEIIIPIHGPHEMALGSYAPGVRLAPLAQGDIYDQVIPDAGPEILSALFRALPKSLINE